MISIQLNWRCVMVCLMQLIFATLHRMLIVIVLARKILTWVVETAANYAIEKAQSYKEGEDNLTWGEYVTSSKREYNEKSNVLNH